MGLNHTDQNALPVETPTLKGKTCRNQKNIATPEEAAARRLLKNEKRRKLLALKLLFETPEEQAIRRMKLSKKCREYRQRKRALETPEKAAERKLANKEASETRRKRKAEQIKIETPEEKAARRNKINEQDRKNRQRQRALETPEQAEIRRAKAAESTRRRKKRFVEAQGIAAWRQLIKKKAKKTERKNQVIPETPEKKATRRLQNSTEKQKEHLTDEWSISDCTETSFFTQETFQTYTDIDSLLDGSTTKAKFQNKNDTGKHNSTETEKEKIKDEFSIFESTETSFVTQEISTFANLNQIAECSNDHERSRPPSRATEFDTENHNSTEMKEQINDETGFITQETFYSNTDFDSLLDGSKMKEILGNKETKNQQKRRRKKSNEDSGILLKRLNYMKMLLDAEANRDEYLVYGEHIAARLRDCSRKESEIRIAKQLLENILSYLNEGVYRCATTAEVNTQIQNYKASMTNIGLEKEC